MKENETIVIHDSKDFHYNVEIRHHPHHGFSTAYYCGRVIGDCQLGRFNKPISDDDREWEIYEERFAEWRDEILSNLKPICKQYFDRQN